MATVYSLVVFGGRTGKAVTFTDAGDIVNLTNNGLIAGTEIFFETTGSLPTGLSTSTTYFARPGADNNKFLLYPTSADAIAGTNQITFSGTGSGTHVVKAKAMTDYLAAYPGRWGSSGSERVYDGLLSWKTGRASASEFDTEVCEIGMAWEDYIGTNFQAYAPAASVVVTTKVDGVHGPGFHGGVVGAGYIAVSIGGAGFSLTSYNSVAEDFSVRQKSNSGLGLGDGKVGNKYRRLIIIGNGAGVSTGSGIGRPGVLQMYDRIVVVGFANGVVLYPYASGCVVSNCLFAKNGTYGVYVIYGGTANVNGYMYNCIAVGNGTNWYTQPSGLEGCSNNSGETADTNQPWTTGAGTHIDVEQTDFVDYTNNDFSPALSTSPQVDAGTSYYGMSTSDIADADAPSYKNGDTTSVDVGPYEYDHGYGPWPATATISLTNIVSGSRVRITKASDGTELYNDVPGTALSHSTAHIGDFNVVVRKASASPYYREFVASGTTVADQTTTIKCLQQLDE